MASPTDGKVSRVAKAPTVESVVLSGIGAWNDDDREAFIALTDPEVLWITSGVFPGLRSEYRGHSGLREFWDDFQEPWERLHIEVERVAEIAPDAALVQAHFHAKGRDGIEVDRAMANHFVIRDEKLIRMRVYGDWDEALADLGVPDPS